MNDMKFWYPASITQITSVNDSFDSCVLSICYAGENRNKTIISKQTIENAIPTMAYCPIVANYDVETDMIGGHDVGFVDSANNGLRMVNLTDAIGVIPESPQWCWVKKVDEDGIEREYLCTTAILWKRTPVYDKLKRDGVAGQSMEINVKAGQVIDGMFAIDAFEFTAFCLLGEDIEPCFEGAKIELFSLNSLSGRLSEMMEDFKKNFTKVIAASADDNITPNGEENHSKGGESSLNIVELLQKYGLTEEDINFETDNMPAEEIERKFAELSNAKSAHIEDGSAQTEGDDAGVDTAVPAEAAFSEAGSNGEGEANDTQGNEPGAEQVFQLTGEQMLSGILEALHTVKYTDEWGEWIRYCYVDYDPAANEVYAYDNVDWNLYGFKYSMNGDNVVVDFDSKTRKKVAFVDFDNGSAEFSYAHILDSVNDRFTAVTNELASLREYKLNTESAKHKAEVEAVFAKFADIADDEKFKELRSNCGDMSVQEVEDKCFAIRGRNVQLNFAQDNPTFIRVPVEHVGVSADPEEPYGGIFREFGF